MIPCNEFFETLGKQGISFYAGVPDSLLKEACSYLQQNMGLNHIITANEGNAIALAGGHYLATGNPGCVYMQNSGEGNAVNPLTSFADPDVYGIPVVLLIGWRGEPGKKDEPQHVKMGKVTLSLLDTLGIPYEVLPQSMPEAKATIDAMCQAARQRGAPAAIVVRADTFEPYSHSKKTSDYEMTREQALGIALEGIGGNAIIVSTTGKLSRELFEYREHEGQGHGQDFLTVGSMGHASSIALGIALQKSDANIYCLDGDGALIMHMGSLAVIGAASPKNLRHIIFNNGSHESVGGQPTPAYDMDIPAIAIACQYQHAEKVATPEELKAAIARLCATEGPALLEILVKGGARKDLGRPTTTAAHNKQVFMETLRGM